MSYLDEENSADTFSFSFDTDGGAGNGLVQRQETYQAGMTVGSDYLLLSLIGRGGMGAVFKAEHKLLPGAFYALKILAPNLVNPDNWQRFEREAKSLARLHHPGVVQIYNLGVDRQQVPFYVMEFLEGQSLAQYLKRKGRLPVESALAIFKQLAQALGSAHKHGIIHRDLKPSNVMLLGDPEEIISRAAPRANVKIVDFGIAQMVAPSSFTENERQRLTGTGEIFGTPYYMSPEQSLGWAVSPATDIYSFGCALFECLTGKPPFVGENAFQTILMHQQAAPPTLSEVCPNGTFSEVLESFIEKMLRKNASQRYQTMDQLVQDLERIEKGKGIFATMHRGTSTSLTAVPTPALESEEALSAEQLAQLARRPFPWAVASLALIMFASIGLCLYFLRSSDKVRENSANTRIKFLENEMVPKNQVENVIGIASVPIHIGNGALRIASETSFDNIAELDMSKVSYLHISNISDSNWKKIMPYFPKMTNCHDIKVTTCNLNQDQVASLDRLPSLRKFTLSHCTFPAGILDCKFWSSLECVDFEHVAEWENLGGDEKTSNGLARYLSRCNKFENLLAKVRNNARLTELSIEACPFSENVFLAFRNSNVEKISIKRCTVTKSVFSDCLRLPHIKGLEILDNSYSSDDVLDLVKDAGFHGELKISTPNFNDKQKTFIKDEGGLPEPKDVKWTLKDEGKLRKLLKGFVLEERRGYVVGQDKFTEFY